MTPDVLAALARVPSPIINDAGITRCSYCGVWWLPGNLVTANHTPVCWWSPFVAAREALLAAGMRVEGRLEPDERHRPDAAAECDRQP
jgi:hypothetical protein